MTSPPRLTDDLIARMLRRRASRANAAGLEGTARTAIQATPQRRPVDVAARQLLTSPSTYLTVAAAVLLAAVFIASLGIGTVGGPGAPGTVATASPSPSSSPTLMPSPVTSPEDGALVPLPPGRQTAASFWPPLTFAVSDEWLTEKGTEHWLALVPDTEGNRAETQAGGFPITFLYVLPNLEVAAEGCEEASEPGIGLTASDIVGALAARPGLTIGGPEPVHIGGLSGQQIDLSLEPGWTETCPGDRTPFVSLVYSPGFVWWGAAPDERFRIIVLDVEGIPSGMYATVAIVVYSADPAAWNDHLAASMAVIDSFEFDTTPPVPGR